MRDHIKLTNISSEKSTPIYIFTDSIFAIEDCEEGSWVYVGDQCIKVEEKPSEVLASISIECCKRAMFNSGKTVATVKVRKGN